MKYQFSSSLLRTIVPFFCFGVASLSAASVNVSLGGTNCGAAGICTSVSGATTITFDGLDGSPLPYTNGFATYTGGGNSPFVTGTAVSEYATPVGDSTTYLTVGSPARPNPVTISFASPITYFGFYYGSPDTYNHISFFSNGNQIATFNGDNLITPADGAWTRGDFVNFNAVGGSFDQIKISSDIAAFETDNHAYGSAVPEPLSMALTGSGLLMACAARRYFAARR